VWHGAARNAKKDGRRGRFKRKRCLAGQQRSGGFSLFTFPMAAQLKKGQLPTKICATCGLPFEYRKKWRNNWAEVKYCGEKCQRNKKPGAETAGQG
jgi:hypothetical protein